MTDDDYIDLLRSTRAEVLGLGLSELDNRITSDMGASDGPYWDLVFYLKHLRDEMQLGSDSQYREIIGRLRRFVRTESGEPIAGIRIEFSRKEAQRYGMSQFELVGNAEFGRLANEIGVLIKELDEDYRSSHGLA